VRAVQRCPREEPQLVEGARAGRRHELGDVRLGEDARELGVVLEAEEEGLRDLPALLARGEVLLRAD